MLHIFWIFNFFVASTNSGRFIDLRYNVEYLINPYTYLFSILLLWVYSSKISTKISDLHNLPFVFIGLGLCSINVVKGFLGGDVTYGYTSLIFLSAYRLASLDLAIVHRFIVMSLGFLLIYTAMKYTSAFLAIDILPLIDVRYAAVSQEGVLRFSNALVFGQRNTAGAAVSALCILYTAMVHRSHVKFSSIMIFSFLCLGFSTMSATAVVIVLLCFIVSRRFRMSNILAFFFLAALPLFWFGDLSRKIESGFTKIYLFFDFISQLDLGTLLVGGLSEGPRPWVESSLLDMIYDVGVFLPLCLVCQFVYFALSHGRFIRSVAIYCMFGLLLLFSNSTLQPPIIMCLILTHAALLRPTANEASNCANGSV